MKTLAIGLVVMGLGLLAVKSLSSAKEPSSADVIAVKAADVKWVDAKGHPRGVKSCLLHGDPTKGAFVALLKIPADTKYAPHTHSADEVVTLVSGTVTLGPGEKVDPSKSHTVDAGGYFTLTAKTPHWAHFKNETVLARYSSGAGDIMFCDPKDAPPK